MATSMASKHLQAERALAGARVRLASKLERGGGELAKELAKRYLPNCQVEMVVTEFQAPPLRGARVARTWRNPRNGELYVLVEMPKRPVVRSMVERLSQILQGKSELFTGGTGPIQHLSTS